MADIAWYSPLAVRISRPGRLPKRNILPLFGFNSPTVASHNGIAPQIGSFGWNHVTKDGIDECSSRCQKTAAQQQFNETSTGARSGGSAVRLITTGHRSPSHELLLRQIPHLATSNLDLVCELIVRHSQADLLAGSDSLFGLACSAAARG